MPRQMPVLATADEIRQIARNAEALIDAVFSEDEDDDDYDEDEVVRNTERIDAAIAAFRFCALAAGELGDPALVPIITGALDVTDRFEPRADDHPTALGAGLSALLRAGAPVDEEIKRLGGHRDARVREAIAEGIQPRGEAAIALLEALSTDAIAQVRNTAKKKLSAVREVAWWKGKFASDPVARLSSAEEAARLKPTLERLSKILDMPRYSLDEHEEELVKLVGELPDALAVEAAELLLSTSDPYGLRLISIGTMMLLRPGGVAAFLRVVEAVCKRSHRLIAGQLTQMLAALPHDRRVSVCKEIIAYLIALPDDMRHEHQESPAWPLSEAVGKAWPPGEDVTYVLDALLSLPQAEGYAHDWVISGLSDVFEQEGVDPTPILDRALQARLAGFPGTWKQLRGSMNTMLERIPGPQLRATAERAILSEDKENIAWGVEQLITRAHDPSRDPPPPEMLARFFADPRYHAVLKDAYSLQRFVIPLLRAELREGRLGYEAAVDTIKAISTIYGGVAVPRWMPRHREDPEEQEAERQEEIAKLGAFLGPPELRGPPTEDEWRILRAARAAYLATDESALAAVLRVLPEGPWAKEDRAVLDQMMAALTGGDKALAPAIAFVLMNKPDQADLPLFDVLLQHSEPDARRPIARCRRTVAELLGVTLSTPPSGRGAEEEEDWLDAPEDDD